MRTPSTRLAETTTILLAPPGAGRTDHVLQTLRENRQQPGWQETWLLTPNRTQEQFLRQRLLASAGNGAVFFNVRFLRFHSLATTLAALADRLTRILQEGERRDLLRDLLADMAQAGELKVFSRVADSGGMLRAFLDFIDDLRANLVSPEALAAAAQGARERELAAIARRYEAALSQGHRSGPDGLSGPRGGGPWRCHAAESSGPH